MSATNSTTNYNLPVFVGTDKPAWLTDWNGAMNTIDGAINSVSTAQQGDATAISTLNSSVQALGDTVSGHTTAITSLNSQVSGNTGSINTINSLIGNGEPTTTDKTIIGAINELNGDIGTINSDIAEINSKLYHSVASITADGVKTYSQLLNDLFTAISEHPSDISGEAVLIGGDNTEYGVFNLSYVSPTLGYILSHSYILNSKCTTDTVVIKNNASEYSRCVADSNGTTITSLNASVPVSGYKFELKSIV